MTKAERLGHVIICWYEGHSISNAILAIIFRLNTLFIFDLAFLKYKFNSPSARQFNYESHALLPVAEQQ